MATKPASHPQSNFIDKQSVSLIESILTTHARVMPDLSTIDKWPNIDGHMDIQDENGDIVGPLTVQVKTLPGNHGMKLSCPVSFLSYCEQIESCLLLGADNNSKKIYWLYLDKTSLKDIDYRSNKLTKTIYFDKSQCLSEGEKAYIDAWTLIVENNKRKIQGYDDLRGEYDTLRENANELVGIVDDKHIRVHQFLDELNRCYDHNFPTTKRFFYSDTWKLGIAYEEYKTDSLTYTLFPVSWDENDVQIKKVDAKFAEESQDRGLGFTGHFAENPIDTRPVEYAKKVAGSKAQKLVQARLLDHTGNEILAREIVFAFMDRFYEQMGFSGPLDEYGIQFILHGFYNYLPLWLDEAYSLMSKENRNNIVEQLRRSDYYDLDVIGQLKPEEHTLIQKKVSDRIGKSTVSLSIASRGIDAGVFLEALRHLKDSNIPVKRVYRKADFARLEGRGGFVWDIFSEEDADSNMRIILDNLETVYNTIIEKNFPGIKDELSLLGDASEIAVYYDPKETLSTPRFGPTYRKYHLKHLASTPRRAYRVIDKSEMEGLEKAMRDRDTRNTGETRLLIASHGRLDFLYSKTPLMNAAYELLEDKLKKYLSDS